MKRSIIETSDGSHTIHVEGIDETYHSRHGAVQEAMHVFINHGLKSISKKDGPIEIFEMGFGTGLNAWLTAISAEQPVKYTGLEAFPVEKEMYDQLNYAESRKELYSAIMLSEWGSWKRISEQFMLLKIHDKLETVSLPKENYDLIYYDAFGPRAQEELWKIEPIEKICESLKIGGVLVTYCAQGQFKRNLKASGMKVESMPGPPGKREMTRAVKL